MARRFLSRGVVLAVASLLVAGAFIFNSLTLGYALRPRSTAADEKRLGDTAKTFGYGFGTQEGATLAHDKVFRVKAAVAFEQGRATPLIGHDAISIEEAVDEFLRKSGEVGVSRVELIRRLKGAQDFLNKVFNPEFIDTLIDEIAGTDESKVKDAKALNFLKRIKEIAAIEDKDVRANEARKAIVDDTRFIVFLFGEKGIDPFLFSVGNILSKEHRALVAHIGTFPYAGGENIAGGPRTMYNTLARIEGYSKKGYRGVVQFRETMQHEFTDLANGRHTELDPEVLAELSEINAEIDKEYKDVTKGVVTDVQEEGSVLVSTPQVTVEKYRLVNDFGKKETFALLGKSKVHPDIPKGQDVTVTIAKADVGSTGGHGTAPGKMVEGVAETWMQAAEQGYVLDFFITRVGDDISVTVTHNKGKDDRHIHELIWNGFVHGATIAKDLGYYGAGQDLLADAFSGNVRGAGPSVAEMVIKEQGSEVLITAQADKTSPGAYNKGLYDIFLNPATSTWHNLGPEEAKDVKIGILDFDYNGHVGRRGWFGRERYSEAYWYLGDQGRYCVDRVVSGKGEDIAAVTAQRLSIEAGEYVGKDDPMFIVRSQKRFPAVGEIVSPFLLGDYLVEGWMRGSNVGPFLPVELTRAQIGIYDGPPLLSMWAFNLNRGRIEGLYDLLAANPAIRLIQDKRSETAVRMLQEGFRVGGVRGPSTEIAYQSAPARIEARLQRAGIWEEFAPEEGKQAEAVAEQRAADAAHDNVAQQVAARNTARVLQAVLQSRWGNLAPVAEALPADIHHQVSDTALAVNTANDGRAYPVLINAETLLTASPDGVMAFEETMRQLGRGNIKFVLHIARAMAPRDANPIIDETLQAINRINGGYTNISLDMFAAVVVGTNPVDVNQQVKDAVGTGIYQVIGPESYARQFKGVIQVALDQAGKGQMALMAKALKLGVELIPVDGKMSQDALQQLDQLFSQDAEGVFHVAATNVTATVQSVADEYQRQLEETGVRV